MKKSNLKISLTTILVTCLVLIPIFSGFTIKKETPQINIEIPNNLKVSQAEIFDGMIVNYTFTSGTPYNSGFEYIYDSGNNFNVSWRIEGSSTGIWVEDASNRLISMSAGSPTFNDGSHTPVWIFTNVSLSDTVLISVDGIGDHTFEITTENIFNIPGFGSVEVWQLEDLSWPGGVAWYEKSTGLLIKGYFTYSSGPSYTLEIYNTNAAFSNVPPVSGLFNGLFMDYNMSGSGMNYLLNSEYTGYHVNTYNCTFEMLGTHAGDWTVDTTTRIMSNVNSSGINFVPGIYTPFWIFTNVSLNDFVLIAVYGDGDHPFQVTESLNLEFGNFGPISVWKLEDMIEPGGFALYEKNS